MLSLPLQLDVQTVEACFAYIDNYCYIFIIRPTPNFFTLLAL